MKTVYGGEEAIFGTTWYTLGGALVDPPEVTVSITKSFTDSVYGPFTSSSGRVENPSQGFYELHITMDSFLVPGNYTVKWQATIAGHLTIQTEVFELGEPVESPSGRLDPPRLYGTMRVSHQYDILGVGITDTIFLIGHGDGIGINSPFQVVNMQEAVNALGGDLRTPLLRGLLETYSAGARDIWLVASAPMSEYVPFDGIDRSPRLTAEAEWGNLTFYERYKERLRETYRVLLDWEVIEVVVPLEAPFHDSGGVNFFDDMVWNCFDRFTRTGFPSMGIMGTQMGSYSVDDIEAMKNADIVLGMGDFSKESFLDYIEETRDEFARAAAEENIPHKFGIIIAGEATIALPQSPTVYNASVAALAAGLLSNAPLNVGFTYMKLPFAINPLGRDLSQQTIKELANLRINPLVRTIKGKRGTPYECVIACDNLFMADGSDYWSVISLRLVSKVIQEVKLLGNSVIGTIQYEQFKRGVEELLKKLKVTGQIKDFTLNISRNAADVDPNQTVMVAIGLTPIASVRELFFQVEVGPGQ